jgi:hypothetical protein
MRCGYTAAAGGGWGAAATDDQSDGTTGTAAATADDITAGSATSTPLGIMLENEDGVRLDARKVADIEATSAGLPGTVGLHSESDEKANSNGAEPVASRRKSQRLDYCERQPLRRQSALTPSGAPPAEPLPPPLTQPSEIGASSATTRARTRSSAAPAQLRRTNRKRARTAHYLATHK